MNLLIRVTDREVRVSETSGKITVGSIGTDTATFEFDSTWNGLNKFACFKNGNSTESYMLPLLDTNTVEIPSEVLSLDGRLYVGALGTKDNNVVIPTVWSFAKDIMKAVETDGKEPTPPEQLLIDKLYQKAEESADIANSVRQDADAGKFNGLSAYQIAVKNGFKGTEQEWLDSLTNGGISLKFGENMNYLDGVISVKTTDNLSNSKLPVTSYGVQKTVGNIEVLLKGI